MQNDDNKQCRKIYFIVNEITKNDCHSNASFNSFVAHRIEYSDGHFFENCFNNKSLMMNILFRISIYCNKYKPKNDKGSVKIVN